MAKASKIAVSPNTVYTKKYEKFRGVDFSRDASMVDDAHSPDAKNLIADTAGFPVKRPGWRTIKNFSGRINGIFSYSSEENKCTVVHAGTAIYKLCDGEATKLITGVADSRSHGKYFKGKLCILTGAEYLVFDGEKCVRAGTHTDVYAPVTLMSRGVMGVTKDYYKDSTEFNRWETDGTMESSNDEAVQYGTVPEGSGINLISGKRKNTFEMTSIGRKIFILDSLIDKKTRVKLRCISTGTELFDVYFNPSGDATRYTVENEATNGVNGEYFNIMEYGGNHQQFYVTVGNSAKRNAGWVHCWINTNNIPGYTHIDGVDDFSIEFTHEVEGYADRIGKCTVMDVFENRLFFSGNPDYPNTDWYSGVNDPLYVPDINYTEIGMESSRIMGYLRTGSEQAILKSDGDDATIYMRSYNMTSDGSVIFPIKHGTSGIGAIAPRAICTFLDDPLYLSRNGVYGIGMQDISNERALNIRSTRVNRRLLEEEKLSDAQMCEWNGYLILCTGGNAYVADAAQKHYPRNATNTFEYEWYYWTNIPARVLYEDEGELYFGTEDGRLCKFNTDMKDEQGGYELAAYSDDGEAIVAEWATNLSDDGNFMQEKTLVKTGSGIMLKPDPDASVTVLIRTERGTEQKIAVRSGTERQNKGLRYSVVPFDTRIKKYGAIQIVCRNDRVNNPFGIGGIIRRFFYGKIIK